MSASTAASASNHQRLALGASRIDIRLHLPIVAAGRVPAVDLDAEVVDDHAVRLPDAPRARPVAAVEAVHLERAFVVGLAVDLRPFQMGPLAALDADRVADDHRPADTGPAESGCGGGDHQDPCPRSHDPQAETRSIGRGVTAGSGSAAKTAWRLPESCTRGSLYGSPRVSQSAPSRRSRVK